MAQPSPFTQAVMSSMRRLYPESLADKSFDNTGLLFEAPFNPQLPRRNNSVLLTIDLTTAVTDEAIAGNHSAVIAYHPIIFRGLKSITLADTQQTSLLRLGSQGISVYSPHTAVDIVPGGMADWLCDIVTGKSDTPEQRAYTAEKDKESGLGQSSQQDSPVQPTTTVSQSRPAAPQRTYSKPSYISYPSPPAFHPNIISHTRSIINPSPENAISTANAVHKPSSLNSSQTPYTIQTTGSGRLITFNDPQPLSLLIGRIASALGNPKAIQIAIPQQSSIESLSIKTVGVCPGSGASVIRTAKPAPDLLFTGELSHHEALAVIERGGAVIALGHSNSERGYLSSVMRTVLHQELTTEWEQVRKEARDNPPDKKSAVFDEILNDESVHVVVSSVDRDPFGTVVLDE